MLIGIGGARLLPRKFIALYVIDTAKTKYASFFVLFSAMGLTLGEHYFNFIINSIKGPAIASLLYYVPNFTILHLEITEFNFPAWIMVFVWMGFLIIFILKFEDPNKTNKLSTK